MLTTITVILVILKLAAVINWSWWLVLLPSLIEIGAALIGLSIMALVAVFGMKRVARNFR